MKRGSTEELWLSRDRQIVIRSSSYFMSDVLRQKVCKAESIICRWLFSHQSKLKVA